jgi:multimeric flavodoxin WrbA
MAHIFIADGTPSQENRTFREHLEKLREGLISRGHTVENIHLAEKTIAHCTGCFSCWLRTPGSCIFKDDHVDFLRSLLRADLVLFASPLILGFPSGLLKTSIDRFIPQALPYIELDEHGECRHPLRYGKTPLMALLYEPEKDTDEEDVQIITFAFERFARNAHTRFLFARSLEDSFEEVYHATANL